MDVQVLGPLQLRIDDREIALRRGRPRRLLLALVLRRGGVAPVDALADLLWPDEQPQHVGNALQILVSYLRKVLAQLGPGAALETVEGGYRLRLPAGAVDADRFEAILAHAPGAAPAERLETLDAALALWRGTPYAELAHEDIARGDTVRLEELRVAARETRIEALLDLGRSAEAVGELQQLVVEHPLNERFYAQLMIALYRSGRQADALATYQTARRVLLDELGIDPGPDLQRLEQAVLAQASELGSAPKAAVPQQGGPREPDGHPVPRTAPAVLPPRGDLVGRAVLLGRLRELIAERRLVTLTGPGGAGKSRLALELVAEAATGWWVDLSPVRDSDGLRRAVATSVGAQLRGDDIDELVTHLRTTDGLLVLDTCEHLVDQVAALVEGLLSQTPVTVLATSRRRLRHREELAWPVPPLTLPDPHRLDGEEAEESAAVELFRRRAVAVDAGFRLDERTRADVARICLLLDGLPLAIELVAAHVAALSPAAIVTLLGDRLRLLVAPGATGRQQGLRTTIEWSYRELTPVEAAMLRRLSVFAGSFPLDAALEVAGQSLGADALHTLLSLVDQSLVAPAGDDRFRLLDTIRAYALEQVDEVEAVAARAAHARWYRTFAVEADRHLRGPDALGWLADLRADMANLRLALQWSLSHGDAQVGCELAAALSWFWAIDGLSGEAVRWLELALATRAEDDALAATLLGYRGEHTASLGRLDAAVDDLRRAAARFDELSDDTRLAGALIYLGIAHWGRGDLVEAAEVHDRAISLFRSLQQDWGLAATLVLRARTALDCRDPVARDLLEAALPVARRAGDVHLVGMCVEERARQALLDGDPPLAAELAAQSLALHDEIGYLEGRMSSLFVLASARLHEGAAEDAVPLLNRGLAVAEQLDHPGGTADGLDGLALVASARADHATALRLLAAADAVRESRSVPRSASRRADVDAVRGAAEQALDGAAAQRATAAGRYLDPVGVRG